MPQIFTLGRAGLTTASGGDGLCLRASEWEQEGDEATVSGVIRGSDVSSLADAKALRDQLAGYDLNTDEPVVPVTWTVDSSRNGFYRVQSVSVSAEVTGRQASDSTSPGKLAWNWEAELLRVPGWQAPLFEVVCSGALRANDHSITTSSATDNTLAWVGGPVGIAYPGLPNTTLNRTSVTGAEGAVPFYYDNAETLFSGSLFYNITSSDFYKGAARIEYSADSGTTWRSIVGRQVPNSVTALRLSNSLVRVTFSSDGTFSVQHHDGSQWETAKVYELYDGDADQTAWAGWVVALRNSPEAVAIKVGATWSSEPGTSQNYFDVTVRRGSRNVECVYATPGRASDLEVHRATNEASTAITGGIRATSNDADGNRFILVSPHTDSTDLLVGGISGAEDYLRFMVGSEIGGSGAAGISPATTQANFYWAAMQHRQRIVAR